MASSNPSWKLCQSFGDKATGKVPVDGQFLAAGDRGGRLSIFRCNDAPVEECKAASDDIPPRFQTTNKSKYTYYTDFQSHDAEFDYLKSLEIEEKINKIKWCKSSNNSLFLLSTNDKTIKLWKVYDKKVQVVAENNAANAKPNNPVGISPRHIRVPKVSYSNTIVAATPKRVFSNAHAYHINSIAINSDGETYLSADDLRVNLWSLGISNQSFTIVDIKPNNMEELTEVITAADFHPTHCNIMLYSSSRGSIRLGDMRRAALCDAHSKVFEEQEDPAAKSFFSEIIASISDIKFSPDGRYIISRDYLTLKIWDLNMESRPVQTIEVHEHLRPRLCDLYESDCIFDKFECSVSPDGNKFMTGSYNNTLHIYDRYGKSNESFEVSKASTAKGRRFSLPNTTKPLNGTIAKAAAAAPSKEIETSNIDFGKKALHTAWHPATNEVAVAVDHGVYIYAGPDSN